MDRHKCERGFTTASPAKSPPPRCPPPRTRICPVLRLVPLRQRAGPRQRPAPCSLTNNSPAGPGIMTDPRQCCANSDTTIRHCGNCNMLQFPPMNPRPAPLRQKASVEAVALGVVCATCIENLSHQINDLAPHFDPNLTASLEAAIQIPCLNTSNILRHLETST